MSATESRISETSSSADNNDSSSRRIERESASASASASISNPQSLASSETVAHVYTRLLAYHRLEIGRSSRQVDEKSSTSEPKALDDSASTPTPRGNALATAIAETRQHMLRALGDLHNERGSIEAAAAEALLNAWAKHNAQSSADCAESPPLAEWTQFQQTLQHAAQCYQQSAEHYASLKEYESDLTMNATFVRLNIARVHKMLVKELLELEPAAPANKSKLKARVSVQSQQPTRSVLLSLDRQEISNQLKDAASKVFSISIQYI